jgi:hypothetical protein
MSAWTRDALSFLCCPQSLQTNSDIVSRFDHNSFLSNPSEFIIHQSFYHLSLRRLQWEQNSEVNTRHGGPSLIASFNKESRVHAITLIMFRHVGHFTNAVID